VLVYDLNLTLLDTLKLPTPITEGWGITHDNIYLYISDGSSNIYTVDVNSSLTVVDTV
jgi:glutamine cyclotransferase